MRTQCSLLVAVCLTAAAVGSANQDRAADSPKSSSKSLIRNSPKAFSSARPPIRRQKSSAAADAATAAPIAVSNQDKIIPHCLMITDVKVVNDGRASQGGKWSFGYLMRAMANTASSGIK